MCPTRTCLAVASLALAACAATPEPATSEPAAAPTTRWLCADGTRFTARVAADAVLLTIDDRALRLAATPAASGARYAAGDVILWSKGDEASLERDGVRHADCRREGPGGFEAR